MIEDYEARQRQGGRGGGACVYAAAVLLRVAHIEFDTALANVCVCFASAPPRRMPHTGSTFSAVQPDQVDACLELELRREEVADVEPALDEAAERAGLDLDGAKLAVVERLDVTKVSPHVSTEREAGDE